jgi:hypothetical protein
MKTETKKQTEMSVCFFVLRQSEKSMQIRSGGTQTKPFDTRRHAS